MSKGNRSQIKTGAILSYLNIGLGNLIPIFYTPIMLALLGQSEYGLYKIAASTSSYLSLMTLGISGAVSRYMIKARSEGGQPAEERIFGLFQRIFNAISLLTCVVGAVIVFNLDVFYSKSLTAAELQRMQILVALMVANMAVGFSATAYTSAITTHERFVFIQCTNILSTVIAPLLNLVVLWFGSGSIGMSIAALGINVLIRFIHLIYVRHSLHLTPRYDSFPKDQLKDILSFSFWILIGNLAGQLYDSTDTMIIGATPSLATTGAAIYNVGVVFPHIVSSLGQVTPILFAPKATKMVFSGSSNEELTALTVRVGRLQSFFVILICYGFILFGRPFITWYAGAEYLSAYWVAIIIMIPNCIPLVQTVALSILRAKNMHRFRSIVYLFIAFINLSATLCLVSRYGIIGAAIPTGLSLLIGNGFVMNWYYHKRVGLNVIVFWKSLLPPIVFGGIISVAYFCLSFFIDLYCVALWIVCVISFIFIYLIALWFFVLNAEEKAIFSSPILRFIRRRKP